MRRGNRLWEMNGAAPYRFMTLAAMFPLKPHCQHVLQTSFEKRLPTADHAYKRKCAPETAPCVPTQHQFQISLRAGGAGSQSNRRKRSL